MAICDYVISFLLFRISLEVWNAVLEKLLAQTPTDHHSSKPLDQFQNKREKVCF